MVQIVVAALSLVAAIAPLAALSKPRRLLSNIRDEARTLDALPEDHPARSPLAESLTRSVKRYEAYTEDESSRFIRRFAFGCYLVAFTFGMAAVAINRYGLDNGGGDLISYKTYVFALVLCVLIAVGAGVFGVVAVHGMVDESISDMSPENQATMRLFFPRSPWQLFFPWWVLRTLWNLARALLMRSKRSGSSAQHSRQIDGPGV